MLEPLYLASELLLLVMLSPIKNVDLQNIYNNNIPCVYMVYNSIIVQSLIAKKRMVFSPGRNWELVILRWRRIIIEIT